MPTIINAAMADVTEVAIPGAIGAIGAISRQDAGKSVDILLSDLPKGPVSQPPDINAKIKPQTVFLYVPES